jgi:hypothetical protein
MGLFGTVKQWAFKGDPRFASVIPDESACGGRDPVSRKLLFSN